MAENTKKPHLNIGTIGHVDHGKTTLTAAILKFFYGDKALTYDKIDKAQGTVKGVTINATHAEFESEKKHYSLIDCPGHQDYVKNMITGTAQMDGGAILLVAADNGLQEQTYEHMRLARQLGIKDLIVFINKADLADEETIELVKMEIKDALNKFKFDEKNTPIIVGSARCYLNGEKPELGEKKIAELIKTIDEYFKIPERDPSKPFRMFIGGANSIPNRGTVVTGKVEQGTIKSGEEVEVIGYGKKVKTTVTGIQMHHKDLEEALPGHDVGLLLRGIKREQIEGGEVAAKEGSIKQFKKFGAKVYFYTTTEGGKRSKGGTGEIKNNFQPQFCIWTSIVTGSIKSEKKIIQGEESDIVVELISPVAMEKYVKFVVREGQNTIGDGTITELIE